MDGAMDAPGEPGVLGVLRGAGLLRGLVGRLCDRVWPRAEAVDDGVSRDRVEPRRRSASFGPVTAGRAPHGRERFLHRLLCGLAVAEAAQRQRVDRPGVRAVE